MKARKPIFVVHKHHATHLHYDLRLEIDGKLASWALRDITMTPSKPLLAIQVSDHPFWYRHFEGVIPEGEYGAGPVMIWDKGLYSNFATDAEGNPVTLTESLKKGLLLISFEGHKLKGAFLLIRISKKQRWILIKLDDEYAKHSGRYPDAWNRSVKSKRTLEQIRKHYQKTRPR